MLHDTGSSERSVPSTASQAGDEHDPQHEQDQRDGVGDPDTEQDEHATDGGAGDRRDLPQRRVHRHGTREELDRRQVRQQRLAGGLAEGARDAEHGHHPEDRRQVGHAGQREREQRERADGQQRVGDELDATPVVSVGDVPGGQDQQDEGQELRERDEAQVERIAGGAEDLPADGDGLDLGRRGDDEARHDVAAEIGMAEDRGPVLVGRLIASRAQPSGPAAPPHSSRSPDGETVAKPRRRR